MTPPRRRRSRHYARAIADALRRLRPKWAAPWWLFFGVATEAERHRFYTDSELILRAMSRFAQQFDDFARRIGEALVPVVRQMSETIADIGRALNRALVP